MAEVVSESSTTAEANVYTHSRAKTYDSGVIGVERLSP